MEEEEEEEVEEEEEEEDEQKEVDDNEEKEEEEQEIEEYQEEYEEEENKDEEHEEVLVSVSTAVFRFYIPVCTCIQLAGWIMYPWVIVFLTSGEDNRSGMTSLCCSVNAYNICTCVYVCMFVCMYVQRCLID